MSNGLMSVLKKSGKRGISSSAFSQLKNDLVFKLRLAQEVKFEPGHPNTKAFNDAINQISTMRRLSPEQRTALQNAIKM